MSQETHDHVDFVALTPWVRVSDRDRELAAQHLRDATSTGALSVTELDRRLGRVLSAATRGDLAIVLLDLPLLRPARGSRLRWWLRLHVGLFAIVNGGLMAIWAAAGFGYFWPVWPMIGWGMAVAGHAHGALLTGVSRPEQRDEASER
jgi:hypothetical protein